MVSQLGVWDMQPARDVLSMVGKPVDMASTVGQSVMVMAVCTAVGEGVWETC